MTVSATYSPPQYVGNGVTTSFGFPFQFFDPADLVPIIFDTTANATVSPAPVLNGSGTYDYVVTGIKDPNTGEYIAGGNVIFNNALLANHRLAIPRNIAPNQPIILTNGAAFPAKTIEGELDRLTLIVQQVLAGLSQALQHPASDPAGLAVTAPPVATRASQVAGWDASGNFIALAPPVATSAVSAAMAPVIAAASLAVAKNLLDVPFSLFANPNATPYAVRAPQDIGTLFSSESMGAAGTFNLPSAASAGAGGAYAFVKRTNNLTVNRAGSDVIQGIGQIFTTLTLTVDGDMLAIESDGTNWKVIAASPNVWALINGGGPVSHGGGRLSFASATQIKFAPYNGGYIRIAGASYPIPAAGITAANTGVVVNGVAGQNLAASTLYYVYLFNNAGTLTIDFSTTGHATDSAAGNVGVEIESGNNTRTLLGMVRTNASSQFEADNALWGVLSWFNRRDIGIVNGFSLDRTTASGTYVEVNSEIRANFLTWGDEAVLPSINGTVANGTATTATATAVSAPDSTTAAQIGLETAATIEAIGHHEPIGISGPINGITEGFHFLTLLGATSSGTGTWSAATSLGAGAAKATLAVRVRG